METTERRRPFGSREAEPCRIAQAGLREKGEGGKGEDGQGAHGDPMP